MIDQEVLKIARSRAFPNQEGGIGISKLTWVATQIYCSLMSTAVDTPEEMAKRSVDHALGLLEEISRRQGYFGKVRKEAAAD